MSADTDINAIKMTLSAMEKDIADIKTGVAVIRTTSQATQEDIGEIKQTLKNHDGRIRAVEVSQEGLRTRTDTQSVIVAALSLVASSIAAWLGVNR